MSVAPTDRSLDDRPIQHKNDVICFGALITESSATRLRTKQGFRRIGKSESRLLDGLNLSEYAARELAAMGYKNVAHYPEGKQGWMEAGLPVEKAA